MSAERDDELKGDTHPVMTPTSRNPITWALVLVGVLLVGAAGGFAVGRMGSAPRSSGDSVETTMTGRPSDTPELPEGVRPTEPAAAGSALATISTPPEGTLAMIDATKLGADARYAIAFSPFGYGPAQDGQTLVIRISTATAEDNVAGTMNFAGSNMLVQLSPGETVVADGGAFTGTLTFRRQGDLLVPVVSDVKVAK